MLSADEKNTRYRKIKKENIQLHKNIKKLMKDLVEYEEKFQIMQENQEDLKRLQKDLEFLKKMQKYEKTQNELKSIDNIIKSEKNAN
jgi:predicted DNA-binding protein YlxM (UPF0122 family)